VRHFECRLQPGSDAHAPADSARKLRATYDIRSRPLVLALSGGIPPGSALADVVEGGSLTAALPGFSIPVPFQERGRRETVPNPECQKIGARPGNVEELIHHHMRQEPHKRPNRDRMPVNKQDGQKQHRDQFPSVQENKDSGHQLPAEDLEEMSASQGPTKVDQIVQNVIEVHQHAGRKTSRRTGH